MFESVVWRQPKSLVINNWNTELREFEHLNASSYNNRWNLVLLWQGAQKTLMVQTAKRHASARMEVNVRAHLAPVPVLLASLERTAVKVSDLCLVFQLASLCSLCWLWTWGCPTATPCTYGKDRIAIPVSKGCSKIQSIVLKTAVVRVNGGVKLYLGIYFRDSKYKLI